MDKVKRYRTLILKIMKEYAAEKYANFDAVNEIIADKENDRYQLITMGWQGHKRVHACTLHFDIINNKIWIQNDQTEHGIANDLLELGVLKSEIVLGYFSPKKRADTEFAVA